MHFPEHIHIPKGPCDCIYKPGECGETQSFGEGFQQSPLPASGLLAWMRSDAFSTPCSEGDFGSIFIKKLQTKQLSATNGKHRAPCFVDVLESEVRAWEERWAKSRLGNKEN